MKDEKKLSELMSFFFGDDLRICQKAAFPICIIADNQIELLIPYIEKMLDNYHTAPHDAFRRNVVRTFQAIDFPEELEGRVYDLCFEEFCGIQKPAAIRAFSTTVLANICVKHPELKEELLPTFIDYANTGSVGFESRLRKETKRIAKL